MSPRSSKIYNNEIGFSDQAKSNLAKIADKAVAFLQLVVDQMQDKTEDFYDKALNMEDNIDQMREEIRRILEAISSIVMGCLTGAGVTAMVQSVGYHGDASSGL